MSEKNLQVILASRPAGRAEESNFRLVEAAVPEPRDGEVLVRVDWLSLDPYMRGRMNEGKSYAARVELGEGVQASCRMGGEEAPAEAMDRRHPGALGGPGVAAEVGGAVGVACRTGLA